MALWPYQADTIARVEEAVRAGHRHPLVICPTGGGKTCMATEWVRTNVERGETVLWLAHRRELIKQAVATLEDAGLDVGSFGRREAAPVQVESIQTLLARREVPPATRVVIDEARHILADKWNELAQVYTDAIVLGLDATPERADGRPMGDVFDTIVVSCQVADLIRLNETAPDRGLVPCRVVAPQKSERTPSGCLASDEIAKHPVDAYREAADGTQAIVFAANIPTAEEYVARFRSHRIPTEIVTGKTKKDERDSHIHRYQKGDVKVLVNVNVLTEGFDAPATETILLGRHCTHVSLFLQITGRGLRPAPWAGKKRCLLIDLRGNVWMHGSPTANRSYDLTGVPIRLSADEAPIEVTCGVCGSLLANGRCPRCPAEERSVEPPRVIDAPLVAWDDEPKDPKEVLAKKDEKARHVAYFADWFREARKNGNSERQAIMRFRRRYGFWPNRDLIDRAKRLAEGSP